MTLSEEFAAYSAEARHLLDVARTYKAQMREFVLSEARSIRERRQQAKTLLQRAAAQATIRRALRDCGESEHLEDHVRTLAAMADCNLDYMDQETVEYWLDTQANRVASHHLQTIGHDGVKNRFNVSRSLVNRGELNLTGWNPAVDMKLMLKERM